MYKQIFINYLSTIQIPGELSEAIEYLLKNTKANYIRPSLVLAWCDEVGGDIDQALPLALAIECLHVSSLIQDDLPCMDNAIMRRETPCLHLAYSESTAILASDALISLTYKCIINSTLTFEQKCKAINLISEFFMDLCNGQLLDLAKQNYTSEQYLYTNSLKTAALTKLACALGVIAANGSDEKIEEAIHFGEIIGLNYQLKDDINDKDGILLALPINEVKQLITSNVSILSTYNNKFLNTIKTLIS